MTYLICSFLNGEDHNRFIFNHAQPAEKPDPRRSRPVGTPALHLSVEEQDRIVREQARIVGAPENSNLEQVILHEEEEREIEINRAKEILENPERLISFLYNGGPFRPIIDDDGVAITPLPQALVQLLDSVKHDTAFLERLLVTHPLGSTQFSYHIHRYIIENINHNQEYFRNIIERSRRAPGDPHIDIDAEYAIPRITSQRYLAEIANDKNASLALRETAISRLTDRRLLQSFVQTGPITLPQSEAEHRQAEAKMILRGAAERRWDELEERM